MLSVQCALHCGANDILNRFAVRHRDAAVRSVRLSISLSLSVWGDARFRILAMARSYDSYVSNAGTRHACIAFGGKLTSQRAFLLLPYAAEGPSCTCCAGLF